jgi:hypothetical protein
MPCILSGVVCHYFLYFRFKAVANIVLGLIILCQIMLKPIILALEAGIQCHGWHAQFHHKAWIPAIHIRNVGLEK